MKLFRNIFQKSDQQKIEINAQELLDAMKNKDLNKALELVNKIDSTYFKKYGNKTKLLTLAAFLGYDDICAIMIKKGANVNVLDEHGRTPLMAACQNGNTDVVKLLINSGADISVTTQGDMTALDFAAQKGHKEIVNLIVKSEGGSIMRVVPQSQIRREADEKSFLAEAKRLEDAGEYEKAIDAYNRMLTSFPRHFGAYNNSGNLYHNLGNEAAALADYRKSIEINPDFLGAYMNVAKCCVKLGQKNEAIRTYKLVLQKLAPKFEKDISFVQSKIRELEDE